MDHPLLEIGLAIATVLFSAGVAWGVVTQKVKDMKENYVDRFDRLERINRENFHALQADMRRLFDRLDSVMTKEDHDRICRWPQGPPFNNNPQGR